MNSRISSIILSIIFANVLFGCSKKITSNSKSRYLEGIYKTNVAPFGLSSTEITFFNNGTCYYEKSRHIQKSFRLQGKYLLSNNRLYIKFDKPKKINILNTDEIGSNWTIIDEYNLYELKMEKKIKYHCKFLIENKRLYVYRFDNGNLVREAETYSEEKGRHMIPFFLEQMVK